MEVLLLAYTALAGVLNMLQSGSNATLHKRLAHPLASATTVYLVGLAVLAAGWLGAAALGRGGLPPAARVAQVPWWGWIGGVLGLTYVFGTLLVAPKLGAALNTAVSVTAAVVTSLVLDHVGGMDFERHPAGRGRVARAVLIVADLGLIAKF